jgi:DNA-binding transcriptional MerR regulator
MRYARLIRFKGRTKSVTQWAKEIGVSPSSLHGRLNMGWSIERALTCRRMSNQETLVCARAMKMVNAVSEDVSLLERLEHVQAMYGDKIGVGQVAEVFGVHPGTVRAWDKQGILSAHRNKGSGHRRYYLEDIRRFIAHKMRDLTKQKATIQQLVTGQTDYGNDDEIDELERLNQELLQAADDTRGGQQP